MRAEFWIVAGPNGAGKTTLTHSAPLQALIPGVSLLNPDDDTLQRLRQRGFSSFGETPADLLHELFVASARHVYQELESRLSRGESVAVETVLSTDKYCGLVDQVVASQGYLRIVYVALRSPELAIERVRQRVQLGGHDVPADKIRQRWHKSLERLPWFLERPTPHGCSTIQGPIPIRRRC